MNVRSILRRVKVKQQDGSIVLLKDYMKTITSEQLKDDLSKALDLTKQRIQATDDRRVLTDLYLVFLSMNIKIGKDTVIKEGPE